MVNTVVQANISLQKLVLEQQRQNPEMFKLVSDHLKTKKSY